MSDKNIGMWINLIRFHLTPDLLNKKFLYDEQNPLAGHCYLASEALYHIAGGKRKSWKPMRLRDRNGVVHWWLMKDGQHYDLTADQFAVPFPYHEGRGGGFLTKKPSKRCKILLNRIYGAVANGNSICERSSEKKTGN